MFDRIRRTDNALIISGPLKVHLIVSKATRCERSNVHDNAFHITSSLQPTNRFSNKDLSAKVSFTKPTTLKPLVAINDNFKSVSNWFEIANTSSRRMPTTPLSYRSWSTLLIPILSYSLLDLNASIILKQYGDLTQKSNKIDTYFVQNQ